MSNQPTIAVLIVAGGSGTRMGTDIPKQYTAINGRPMIRHTIESFKSIPTPLLDIYCVIDQSHTDWYNNATQGLNLNAPIIGGTDRQSSVYNGLEHLSTLTHEYVIIHDAARPCVLQDDIHNIIHRIIQGENATLATPISETIQRNTDTIDRENLFLIQTPQAFKFDTIWASHQQARQNRFIGTDDASIARHCGHSISMVTCGRHNLKITTQDDLYMASQLLQNKTETRVGNGFDVHAFSVHPAQSIRLCGIDIPYTRSLSGHSDADVGLHAITDAIFGALADGDIGSHFPPSNQNFKNMDSHVFLDKALNTLKERHGRITHLDVTFMCEQPKIGLHRDKMREHLAQHLNISINRISIKATTTEKLGFTGREEGIACQAIVTTEILNED